MCIKNFFCISKYRLSLIPLSFNLSVNHLAYAKMSTLSEARRERLEESLKAFLDGEIPRQQPEALTALENMLNSNPAFQPPHSSLLENDKWTRYYCAQKIQEKIREVDEHKDFRLQAVHVAIILEVPITCLTKSGHLSHEDAAGFELYDRLKLIADLTKHCMLNPRILIVPIVC